MATQSNQEKAALKVARDDARGLLASATDLANSWAREASVIEAHNEQDIKGVIDRLWAKTSAAFYEEVRKRDAALAERTRRCAEALCPYCKAVHYYSGSQHRHYWDHGMQGADCYAAVLRRLFPEAFEEVKCV